MKKPFLAALGALVILLQVVLTNQNMEIVNAHESIEDFSDIATLQEAMDELGIQRVILHGIPEDLLHFDGGEVQLSEVSENNAVLADVAARFPDNFDFFCSIDPSDDKRLEQLNDCIQAGAEGVKFYVGYSYAHTRDIDDPELDDFYTAMSDADMVLMLPVNQQFESELINLLTVHSELPVICPHFCLSSSNLDALRERLDEFDNLYIDISFGHIDFVREGFERISNNADVFQNFFRDYSGRILFATANVITSYEDKDSDFVVDLYADYLNLLEKDSFESALDPGVEYNGLSLSYPVLSKVLWKNIDGLLK